MIHDLKPYPAYKDSGVPWLGEVPEHWKLQRMKTILKERSQKGFPDETLLAATQTKGVVRKELYENRTVLALKDLHLLKLVLVGDFVISLRSFQGGIEYAHEQGIISPAYTILYPVDAQNHGFLARLFKSKPYIENLTLFVTGIRQGQNIDYEKLSRSELPLPPISEQSAIVRYIDHIDQRIRRYIRTKQKLIKLLEEQKKAIIHQAVTRGLDPNVKFKPSGVEWLGDVPEHWELKRIKHLARLRSGDAITSLEINEKGDYPVFGGNGLRGFTDKYTHQGDFVLIGRQGALCGNINYARGIFWASEHAVVSHPIKPYNLCWFGELLRTMNLNQYSISAAQPGLAVERIQNLSIPVPPYEEQTAIDKYITSVTTDLERAISQAHREISLLREYRTRLIADIVTGKLDVREAAENLPNEIECHETHDLDEDFCDSESLEEELSEDENSED